MTKIITKRKFDAAHRLYGYDGPCGSLHGHSWKVEVEMEAKKLQLPIETNNGIFVDFKDIKKIIDYFDHATILNVNDPLYGILLKYETKLGYTTICPMSNNPTAENIAYALLSELEKLEPNVTVTVRVWESDTSYAEVSR